MSALTALQATLAAQHAAIYLYGVLGGQVSAAQDPARAELVRARFLLHQQRRDDLVEAVRARDAEPVAAAVAYALPRLEVPDDLRLAALDTEQRCGEQYAALVARSDGALRSWAVDALVESSIAALAWGAAPEPFPGASEL